MKTHVADVPAWGLSKNPSTSEAARERAWLRPRRRRYLPSSDASCVLARHAHARVPTAPGFSDRPLEQANEAFETALAGEPGRVLVTMNGDEA